MLTGSKSPVDDFANTFKLFENLRYFMKDYDILAQELGSDYGMRKVMHYATMIRQAVDQLKGGESWALLITRKKHNFSPLISFYFCNAWQKNNWIG